jgi:tetratricopeptide (TPR) repeat protein
MNLGSNHPRRLGRIVPAVAIAASLALGATACGGSSDKGSSSSAQPDSKKASAALNAGLKAHANGDLTAATADYKKTLKYDPTNKFAFYNLAIIDEASGNYGLAEQKYRAALKTDAKYEPALFNLAILRTSRDPKEAIALYRRAVAVNTKDASAWLNLGLLLRAAGNETGGNHAVSHAIALNPKLKDPAKSSSTKG